jgi:hypothetical protein
MAGARRWALVIWTLSIDGSLDSWAWSFPSCSLAHIRTKDPPAKHQKQDHRDREVGDEEDGSAERGEVGGEL